jgi:hypothetical protein
MNDPDFNPPIPPFETEAELWESALNLLLDLRLLRGLGNQRPDHESAEQAITAFCSKLRECPQSLSLPRLQETQQLQDRDVVVVAHVLAGHWGMEGMFSSLKQVAVVAYGFEPPSLERFRFKLAHCDLLGQLLCVEQTLHSTVVHPSGFLLPLIGEDRQWDSTAEDIQQLPTAPADRDVPPKRKRK